MKIQKKFIIKVLSALCVASAISMTIQPIVSANSQKNLMSVQADNNNQNTIEGESNQNINQTAQNNQGGNENIENNQNVDPIKMYTTDAAINANIIDENSQDPKDIDRNQRRKCANYALLRQVMGIYELYESDRPAAMGDRLESELIKHKYSGYCQIAKKYVENDFDIFMYCEIIRYREYGDISSYFSRNEIQIGENGNDEAVNFNFLFTKAKISEMLLDQEKDLIKKFLLKIEYRKVFEAMLDCPVNMLERFKNPYYGKQAIETFYYNILKEYYKNSNIEYDINANNLKAKKEAYEAALSDAENQTESDLDQKEEIFKKTYYETLALANAEIDVKACRGRQNKLIKDKNMQQIYKELYDNQYNEVVKKIGAHDGKIANLRKIFENDPSAQANYDEGYLNDVIAKAKENSDDLDLDYESYQWQKSREVYSQTFKDAIYQHALDEAVHYNTTEIFLDRGRWQEFFMNYYNDNAEITEFKKSAKQSYIDGFREGLKERGRQFAHANETDKEKYAFEKIKFKQPGSREFYDDFKKAFEQGLEEGLKEVELQKAKK